MKTYFLSDTHFDHENIIKYCDRPFKSKEDMNETLINNWNKAIGKYDIVYHLGDWGMTRHVNQIDHWSRLLNGRVIAILGQHDKQIPSTIEWHKTKVVEYKLNFFYLVHMPYQVDRWKGWIIHGHTHNTQMEQYPFINGIRKTINVSVELTDYKPVCLDFLMDLGLNTIKYMRTIHDKPVRF